MMDFITQAVQPIILGICLCLGYVVKKWIPDVDNKFIPTINFFIGIVLAVWIGGWSFTPEIILNGAVSGLSATGLYEAFRNIMEHPQDSEI